MGTANLTSAGATVILSNSAAVGFRDYWEFDGALNTTWIPLVQGTYYYIEVRHAQALGGEHVSVAVKIERAASATAHPNSM